MNGKTLSYAGIRVVEFTHMVMADLGAAVSKIPARLVQVIE